MLLFESRYAWIPALTRIFHTVSTDAAQAGISTALRLFGRLDILSNMSALPALRAPCIYARLRALDTKRYEISGLIFSAERSSKRTFCHSMQSKGSIIIEVIKRFGINSTKPPFSEKV